MINKIVLGVSGYKTYVVAVVGILVAFVAAAWGPIDLGPVQVPAIEWKDFWGVLWNGGLLSFLRMGVKKQSVEN